MSSGPLCLAPAPAQKPRPKPCCPRPCCPKPLPQTQPSHRPGELPLPTGRLPRGHRLPLHLQRLWLCGGQLHPAARALACKYQACLDSFDIEAVGGCRCRRTNGASGSGEVCRPGRGGQRQAMQAKAPAALRVLPACRPASRGGRPWPPSRVALDGHCQGSKRRCMKRRAGAQDCASWHALALSDAALRCAVLCCSTMWPTSAWVSSQSATARTWRTSGSPLGTRRSRPDG